VELDKTNGFFRGPCWRAFESISSRDRRLLDDELAARGGIGSQCGKIPGGRESSKLSIIVDVHGTC
jgi:hypothetical protein